MPKIKKCQVRECESRDNHYRFLAFPKDPAMHNKWKKNSEIPPTQGLPQQSAFICIKHFEEDAVGGKFLKIGAIPNL